MINQNLDMNALSDSIFQIFFFRLRFLFSRLNTKDPFDKDIMVNVLTKANLLKLNMEKNKGNPTLIMYFKFLLLNCSRSFLETEMKFRLSTRNVIHLLEKNFEAMTVDLKTNPNEKLLIQSLNKRMIPLLRSAHFKKALHKFLQYYNLTLTMEDDLVNRLIDILDSIIFMRGIDQFGMIGEKTNIYINFDIIAKFYAKGEMVKLENYYCSTVFHEFGHIILRILQDNTFSLTPRSLPNDPYESGYRFEIELFGAVIMEFDGDFSILDESRWNNEFQQKILPNHMIQNYVNLSEGQNFLLSGYSYILRGSGFK